jgi:hypothetical protein
MVLQNYKYLHLSDHGLVVLAWDLGVCAPLNVSGSIPPDANFGQKKKKKGEEKCSTPT